MSVTYRYEINAELKKDFLMRPYIEYQLIKLWEIFGLSLTYEDQSKVIFKSKDKSLVEKFMKELEGQ